MSGRPGPNGRSMSDPHVRLFAWMTNSEAWKALSGNAIKVILHIASYDDGKNNGEIFMSERHAAQGTGLDKKTVRRALVEAQEKGFLVKTGSGCFKAKRSPAATWRLTWKSSPPLSMAATNDWRKWKPGEKSRGENFPTTGGEIPPSLAESTPDGGEIPPMPDQNPQFCVNQDGGEKGAQIIATAAVSAIRSTISEWWRMARPKERAALAKSHDLTVGELLAFVIGDGEIAFPKLVAVRASIAGPIGRAA